MTMAVVNKNIPKPGVVWQSLSRIGEIGRWHPDVLASRLISQTWAGIGAVRQSEFYDKSESIERVIDWNDMDSIRFVADAHNLPYHQIENQYSIKALADDTELTVEMAFEPKYSVFGAAWYGFLARSQVKSRLKEWAHGFQSGLEKSRVRSATS